MEHVKKLFGILLLASVFMQTSCEKKDKPIILPPLPPGDTKIQTANMGTELETEYFLDLSSGNLTPNQVRNWDLAFDCDKDGFHIFQNGGKFILTAIAPNTTFENLKDTSKLKFNWDSPTGSNDSTAFGNWFDPINSNISNSIYVVDRGVYEKDFSKKYVKIQFLGFDGETYHLKYALLNGDWEQEVKIKKNPSKNRIYLLLGPQNQILDFEPQKNNWDLRITHYRHIYFELIPQTPYLVSGVLLNPNGVSAYRDSLISYEGITLDKALQLEYKFGAETIGFDWKAYDVNQSKYTIRNDLSYIIKDSEGLIFKLRFLDYYDSNGQRGVPKYEYLRL